jgi:hypothetical protein
LKKARDGAKHHTNTFSAHSPMASNNPTRIVALFCWILGVSNRPFSIAIEDSAMVDDLKKAIVKEKPAAFANVDPDQLTLWKVFSFLRFDQFLGYIPLSQGIYHDRQEPQGENDPESDPTSLSRRRRVARGTPIVENLLPP